MASWSSPSTYNWVYAGRAAGRFGFSFAIQAAPTTDWVYFANDQDGSIADLFAPFGVSDIGNSNVVLYENDAIVLPTVAPRVVPETAVDAPLTPGPPPTEQMILAHFMAWFRTPEVTGRWLHWGWDPDGDGGLDETDRLPYVFREDGLPDLATAHQPLIGPYDSADPDVIEYQLASAWASGLNGFVVDWYGPDDLGGVDKAVRRMNEQIVTWRSQYNIPFFLALMYEEQILIKEAEEERLTIFIEHIEYLLEVYAAQDSYLTYEGVPVLFFFEVWEDGQPGLLSPEEIEIALTQLPPVHLLYMGAESDYLPAVDGFFTWIGGANSDRDDWGADYSNWLFPEQDFQSDQHQLDLTVGSVWAGFDDSKVQGWDPTNTAVPRTIARRDGFVYSETWARALTDMKRRQRTGPAWVQIVTWNDWNEGSEIEPSLEYGRYYLEQTQLFAQLYSGQQFPPEALIVPQAIYELRQANPNDEMTETIIQSAYELFFQFEFLRALELLERAGASIE